MIPTSLRALWALRSRRAQAFWLADYQRDLMSFYDKWVQVHRLMLIKINGRDPLWRPGYSDLDVGSVYVMNPDRSFLCLAPARQDIYGLWVPPLMIEQRSGGVIGKPTRKKFDAWGARGQVELQVERPGKDGK